MFGEYPRFINRYLKEHNIKIEMKDGDLELLKEGNGEGNMIAGVKNPFLKASEWRWKIDPTGLRI